MPSSEGLSFGGFVKFRFTKIVEGEVPIYGGNLVKNKHYEVGDLADGWFSATYPSDQLNALSEE